MAGPDTRSVARVRGYGSLKIDLNPGNEERKEKKKRFMQIMTMAPAVAVAVETEINDSTE